MNDAPIGNSQFFDSSTVSKLEQLSDEGFWNLARELAGGTYSALQHSEYLECEFASGSCFISLTALHEVVLPPHRLALLPDTPEWMRGIIAWQSEILAVVDLDAYLSGSSSLSEPFSEGMLLVTRAGEVPIGLLVPTVGTTKAIALDPATMHTPVFAWYMPGRAKDIEAEKLVLDLDALLADVVQQMRNAYA
jgi:chemotaxis signal transduction protein